MGVEWWAGLCTGLAYVLLGIFTVCLRMIRRDDSEDKPDPWIKQYEAQPVLLATMVALSFLLWPVVLAFIDGDDQ